MTCHEEDPMVFGGSSSPSFGFVRIVRGLNEGVLFDLPIIEEDMWWQDCAGATGA